MIQGGISIGRIDFDNPKEYGDTPISMVLFIEEQQEKLNLESIKSLRRLKSESTANRI